MGIWNVQKQNLVSFVIIKIKVSVNTSNFLIVIVIN